MLARLPGILARGVLLHFPGASDTCVHVQLPKTAAVIAWTDAEKMMNAKDEDKLPLVSVPALCSGTASIRGSGGSSSCQEEASEGICSSHKASDHPAPSDENAAAGMAGDADDAADGFSDFCSADSAPSERTATSIFAQCLHEVAAEAVLRGRGRPPLQRFCSQRNPDEEIGEARANSEPGDEGGYDSASECCVGGATPSQCTASSIGVQGWHEVAAASRLRDGNRPFLPRCTVSALLNCVALQVSGGPPAFVAGGPAARRRRRAAAMRSQAPLDWPLLPGLVRLFASKVLLG